MVCSATDTRFGVQVAIKKLFNTFTHHTFAQRCYRELKILQHLKHDNCLCLLDVFTPAERYESFTCVYLVTPLMTTDLGRVLKGNFSSVQHLLTRYVNVSDENARKSCVDFRFYMLQSHL